MKTCDDDNDNDDDDDDDDDIGNDNLDDKEDTPENFLYLLLQDHNISNLINVLVGSLNINNMKSEFHTVNYILKNRHILAVCDRSMHCGDLTFRICSNIPKRRGFDM